MVTVDTEERIQALAIPLVTEGWIQDTEEWTIPPVTEEWTIPPVTEGWIQDTEELTIPPVTEEWTRDTEELTLPPVTEEWTRDTEEWTLPPVTEEWFQVLAIPPVTVKSQLRFLEALVQDQKEKSQLSFP